MGLQRLCKSVATSVTSEKESRQMILTERTPIPARGAGQEKWGPEGPAEKLGLAAKILLNSEDVIVFVQALRGHQFDLPSTCLNTN